MHDIICRPGWCEWVYGDQILLSGRPWALGIVQIFFFTMLTLVAWGFFAWGYDKGRRAKGKVYVR